MIFQPLLLALCAFIVQFPGILCLSASETAADTPVASLLSSATALLAAGRFDDALTVFDTAILREPTNYLSLFKRGATYLSLGRDSQALSDFERVLKVKPGFEGALLQRAKIRSKNGEWAGARNDYRSAKKSNSPELSNIDRAEKAALEAAKAEKQADWERCVTKAGEAISVAPTSLALRNLRANCRLQRGEVHEAVVDLQQVLQLNPGDIEPYIRTSALMFYSLGESDRGLTQIKKCLHSDPEEKRCKAIFRRLKAHDKELKKLNKAMDKRQFATAAKLLVGSVTDTGLIQQIDEEVKKCREEGALHPTAPSRLSGHLSELACEAYFEMNSLKKAGPHCAAALVSNPRSIAALLHKSQILSAAESFTEAISTLNTAKDALGDATERFSRKVQDLLQKAQVDLRRSKQKDYYKVLKVDRSADAATLKRAYRKASKDFHPDRHRVNNMTKEEAEAKMRDINQAWEVLNDPEKKSMFDNGRDPNDPEQMQQGNPFQGNPFGGGFAGGFSGGQQFVFKSGPGGFQFPGGFGQGGFQFP